MDNTRGNALIRAIRRFRIQTRLLVIFLFLSLIPVLFIGIFAYTVYTNSINEKLGASAEQAVKLLNATLDTELERYAFYIDSLSISDVVQQILTNSSSSGGGASLAPGEVRAIRRIIDDTSIQPPYLKNIRIAGADGSVIYDSGYEPVSQLHYDTVLAQIEESSPRDSLGYVRAFRMADTLVLGRKIQRFATDKHIGYIMIFINEKLLSNSVYSDISYGESGQLLLVNSSGFVLSSKDNALIGTSIADEDLFRGMLGANAAGKASFGTRFADEDSLAVFNYSSQYDCFFVATVPYAYIQNETRHITIQMLIVSFVLILLCIAATSVIYPSIMQPIRTIVSRCNVVADEDLDRDIGDESPDELGFLARTIDRIIAELKGMAYEWQNDQKRKRELELEMLNYQINPHFLFNTLNTLRWIAAMNEVPVLEQGISSLSSLLQSTLVSKAEFISISEEIENLKNYFYIQRLRYADSFNVRYKLDEVLLNCKIPRFILQPVAENSIIHGTRDGKRKINITVSCFEEDDRIKLKISDDGMGFEMSGLDAGPKERFSGIGLKNVDERLRLYFGEGFGLIVKSVPDEGTECTISIPRGWLDSEVE